MDGQNNCKLITLPGGSIIELNSQDEKLHLKEAERRFNKYCEALNQYSRIGPPDKDRLSELVTKAKGPGRTMKQFSEDVGTTPSTLSRIVNKQNRGANSDKLIADIAAHADPQSGVTFEQLMEAHGMAEKKDSALQSKIFEQEVRKIIINELYCRKYTIVNAGDNRRQNRHIYLYLDFALKTDALHNGDDLWGFEIIYLNENMISNPSIGAMNVDRHLTQIMTSYYIGDCLYNKVSVVIASKSVFECFKNRILDRMGERKIKDEISIILVDTEKGCLVEEFIIPNKKNDSRDVFFHIEKGAFEEVNDNEQDNIELFD